MLWAIRNIALIKAGYTNKINQPLQKRSSHPPIHLQMPDYKPSPNSETVCTS